MSDHDLVGPNDVASRVMNTPVSVSEHVSSEGNPEHEWFCSCYDWRTWNSIFPPVHGLCTFRARLLLVVKQDEESVENVDSAWNVSLNCLNIGVCRECHYHRSRCHHWKWWVEGHRVFRLRGFGFVRNCRNGCFQLHVRPPTEETREKTRKHGHRSSWVAILKARVH